jgi:uncharacterized protein
MKIVVVSDVHGDYQRLSDIIDAEKDASNVIFLGDGLAESEMLQDEHPALRIYTVRGNCDYASFSPTSAVASFEGVNFFYTHGQLYGVKNGTDELAEAARARTADVALFGHTHIPCLEKREGLTLFNPGAVTSMRGSMGSYGVIEVKNGSAQFEHKKIK